MNADMDTQMHSEQQDYRRIEQAIHWLTDHYQEQPSLGRVAEEVGSANTTSSACSPPGPGSARRSSSST
jgi:AraC-like DNA-binding protein